jgi:hypothetical protein
MAKNRDERLAGCGAFREEIVEYRENAAKPFVPQPRGKRKEDVVARPSGQISRAALFLLTLSVQGTILWVWGDERRIDTRQLAIGIMILVQLLIQLRVVFRCWRNIQDGSTSATAGWATASLLIPLVAVSAWFRGFFGYARQFNRFLERNKVQTSKIGAAQAFLFAYGLWSVPAGIFGVFWPFAMMAFYNDSTAEMALSYGCVWILMSLITALIMAGANNRLMASRN